LEKINYKANISFGPRVRKSPYFEATMRAGAKAFTIYNHVYLPTVFTGPTDEYWKLVNGVTLWDVACQRQIEISGPDALAFTQYLTPRNLGTSEPGKCMYVLMPDEHGGIINDAVLLHINEEKLWLSPGDGDALLWVQGAAVNTTFDVTIHEPPVSPLQLQGPHSPHVAKALFGEAILDLEYYRLVETELDGVPVVVSRTGWSGEIGYEIYPLNDDNGEQIWSRIMEAGQPWNIAPIAPSTIRSVEGGLLSFVSDITRDDSPYTFGMDRLVDLDQENEFIGKDALRQIRNKGPKRQLVGFEMSGEPIKGSNNEFWPVLANDQIVGRVTRCVFSPRLQKNIGFANVPFEFQDIGTELTVVMPDGSRPAEVCKWPWFSAKKKIDASEF
jgi:aminomethyltransferase